MQVKREEKKEEEEVTNYSESKHWKSFSSSAASRGSLVLHRTQIETRLGERSRCNRSEEYHAVCPEWILEHGIPGEIFIYLAV